MNAVIQNATMHECTHGAGVSAAIRVPWHCAFCILHSPAYAAAPASDFFTGHMRDTGNRRRVEAGAAEGSVVQAAAQRAAAARRAVQGRIRPRRDARQVLQRAAAGDRWRSCYYQCPMLCTQVMNGISSALRALHVHRRARTSTSCSSASTRATRRRRRARRSGAPRVLERPSNRPAAGIS